MIWLSRLYVVIIDLYTVYSVVYILGLDAEQYVGSSADGKPDNLYVFKALDLPLNTLCSALNSTYDMLIHNTAAAAGGAIFSTDMDSMSVMCPSGESMQSAHGCDAWLDNDLKAPSDDDQSGPG